MPPWRIVTVPIPRTTEILGLQVIKLAPSRRGFSTSSGARKRDNEIAAKVFAHHVKSNPQASADQKRGGMISDPVPERDASQFTPSRPSIYRQHSHSRDQATGEARSQSNQSQSNRPSGKLLRLNRPPQRPPPQNGPGQRRPTKRGPDGGGAFTERNRRRTAGSSIGAMNTRPNPEEKPVEFKIEPDEHVTAADIKEYQAMPPEQLRKFEEEDMKALRQEDPNLYALTKMVDRATAKANRIDRAGPKFSLEGDESETGESDELTDDEAYVLGEDRPSREPVDHEPSPVTLKSLRLDWPAFPSSSQMGLTEGVEEKLYWLARRFPHGHEGVDQLAKRLMKGELVQFSNEKEKEDVMEFAQEMQSEEVAKAYTASGKILDQEPINFQPLGEGDRSELVGSMVKGEYNLPAKQKSPVMDGIVKALANNTTYRGAETQKFMAKLETMMTTASPPRQSAKA